MGGPSGALIWAQTDGPAKPLSSTGRLSEGKEKRCQFPPTCSISPSTSAISVSV